MLLLSFVVILSLTAQADTRPDMAIFGLELERPFNIPECPKMKIGKSVT